MGVAAVFALTACDGLSGKGTKVSEEQFKEKAAAVEEHQYSEATIKWSSKEETTLPDMEKLYTTGEIEMKTEKDSDSGETKFTFSNGKWSTEDAKGDSADLVSLLSGNLKDVELKDLTSEYSAMADQYKVDSTINYYVNPLGISLTAKGDFDNGSAGSGKLDLSAYMSFDKYGYVTKAEYKVSVTGTGKVGEKSYSAKMLMQMTATISYK